ncbi:hypothetical protein Glove_71g52 [Diversispora epigaea]|uniref:Uncharacterized protein n=1 Tax=Diversispora epigaea TaxID=1348612 RepID=A0A397JE77_9GLOM|nr:hypothetical protein Glove_71g52 [Diversispora epigaea]
MVGRDFSKLFFSNSAFTRYRLLEELKELPKEISRGFELSAEQPTELSRELSTESLESARGVSFHHLTKYILFSMIIKSILGLSVESDLSDEGSPSSSLKAVSIIGENYENNNVFDKLTNSLKKEEEDV